MVEILGPVLDPIIDTAINLEKGQFEVGKVNRFLANTTEEPEDPSRHYSQSVVMIDEGKIERALGRLGIPSSSCALIFGGYTGQFAACLKNVGLSIIFSDPMKDWVERASASGFESYMLSAEELPGSLIGRSQLMATFECYIPFNNELTFLYNGLRFLTTDHGILFAESDRTRKQITSENGPGRLGQMKSTFAPFKKVYDIDVRFVEAGEVRLYNFKAKEAMTRDLIKHDCQVIKSLYDNVQSMTKIDERVMRELSATMCMEAEQISSSVDRFHRLFLYNLRSCGPEAQFLPGDKFRLFSKRYRLP